MSRTRKARGLKPDGATTRGHRGKARGGWGTTVRERSGMYPDTASQGTKNGKEHQRIERGNWGGGGGGGGVGFGGGGVGGIHDRLYKRNRLIKIGGLQVYTGQTGGGGKCGIVSRFLTRVGSVKKDWGPLN